MSSPFLNIMDFSNLTSDQEMAINSFGDTLEHCKALLACGMPVELPGNVEERFGSGMAGEYLAYQLSMETGQTIDVSTSDDDCRTIVRLAPEKDPRHSQFQLSFEPTSFASNVLKEPVSDNHNASAIRKNPPRPMNCWMLYRDTRHKQLKDQYPHLTVQQISTLCSEDWRNLPVAQKDEWRARARDAKEEHQRMYPDYKYSPRKPGQKKKRQSRKATQAATSATVSVQTILSDENSAATPLTPTVMATDTNLTDTGASEAIMDNINNGLFPSAAEPVGTVDGQSIASRQPTQNALLHDNETARHDILQAQLPANPGTDSIEAVDLFGDEAYAFRNGADETITLPCFNSEMF